MTTTADRLRTHVDAITAHGPRHARTNPQGMIAARAYAVAELEAQGWDVVEIPFATGPTVIADVKADSRNPLPVRLARSVQGVNVVATRPDARGPFLMIGAHLDTVAGSTGADDNGSGVVTVLELAAREKVQGGNVMLALFDAEESGQQGAAAIARQFGHELTGLINLEMIGYFDDTDGAQALPLIARLTFRSAARQIIERRSRRDFILLVENKASRRIGAASAFGLIKNGVPAIRVADPRPQGILRYLASVVMPAASMLDRSDHAPFWNRRIPAIMVVSGTPNMQPHYHRTSDGPESLDYDRLAKVVNGLAFAAGELAPDRHTP